MAKIRHPYVAGAFYAGSAESLKRQIENECFLHPHGPGKIPKVSEAGPRRIVGLICPHAGYMYSGPVAAHAYYSLAVDGKPEVIVLLGPNHSGLGSALAIMNEGVWRTPLGEVEVEAATANQIVKASKIIDVDAAAHRYEHSIEVQLPFLQYIFGSGFRIVPICFLMQDLTSAREVGEAVARALDGKNAVIIASSDMSHYEPHKTAERKDKMALQAVEAMDEEKFYSIIESYNVTACGYGPIAALITAARMLGAKEAKLLCYRTSGDISGDYSSVVGYAAVQFTK
ncbi:MAG: AmmeMemoRadiSam system protein B [Nitrososphaerota archaeon]|nr:AmmeMemoRadiSam system protein B [Candidatus Bathyarchaeota archaeon]MDW8194325.1 AmmeMemoRadiSam system protein B [Nitrososphaerota archaeon]